MSTKILIIPEDSRKDQYILKPIIQAMFKALDKPNVIIEVYPALTGIAQALNKEALAEIFEVNPMVDVFLLCVDRDDEPGRREGLTHREVWAAQEHSCTLIAENAWQEIEVWVLAGLTLPTEWQWSKIRAERDSKEIYFIPFAQQSGVLNTPGQGRKILAEEAAHNYKRIKQMCQEDVAALEENLRRWFAK